MRSPSAAAGPVRPLRLAAAPGVPGAETAPARSPGRSSGTRAVVRPGGDRVDGRCHPAMLRRQRPRQPGAASRADPGSEPLRYSVRNAATAAGHSPGGRRSARSRRAHPTSSAGRAVRARDGHRIPRVRHREDAGAFGDRQACQPVGVAEAVEALVVVADPGRLLGGVRRSATMRAPIAGCGLICSYSSAVIEPRTCAGSDRGSRSCRRRGTIAAAWSSAIRVASQPDSRAIAPASSATRSEWRCVELSLASTAAASARTRGERLRCPRAGATARPRQQLERLASSGRSCCGRATWPSRARGRRAGTARVRSRRR